MIAYSSSGRNFFALVHYLLHGRTGEEHARVAWTAQRNLALEDPEHAPALMRATATQNHRVEQPVYHLVLAFDPSDLPTPGLMRNVADRLLDDLGLATHQVLMVAHRDRAHAHLHLVVNRVHPDTTRAWDRWQDHLVTQRALRQLERAHHLREVSSPARERSRKHVQGEREPRVNHHRQRISPAIEPDRLPAIEEAKQRLFEADLPRHMGRLQLELTRAQSANRAWHDRLDYARRQVDLAARRLYTAFDRVYERPRAAMERFDETIQQRGVGVALRQLRERPETYTGLRKYVRPAWFGLVQKEDDQYARELAERSLSVARRYTVAAVALQAILREYDPKITRADLAQAVRVEAEIAANTERLDREHRRLGQIRARTPNDQLLHSRGRDALRNLSLSEIVYLKRAVGSRLARLATRLLSDQTVRAVVMGREINHM